VLWLSALVCVTNACSYLIIMIIMETVSLSSTVRLTALKPAAASRLFVLIIMRTLFCWVLEVCSFSVILGRAVLKLDPTGESFACQVMRHSSARLLEESVR